ncbi:exoribonuclease II [Malassezia sp. CBS 17886]|nr:exoribonuclease II [Malassezia sp. CBS 17886]
MRPLQGVPVHGAWWRALRLRSAGVRNRALHASTRVHRGARSDAADRPPRPPSPSLRHALADTPRGGPLAHGRRSQGRPMLDPSVMQKNDPHAQLPLQAAPEKRQRPYNVPLNLLHRVADVQPGDFVEVRRSGRVFSGVVLPIPESAGGEGVGQGTTLAVVLATGVLEQARTTDVMMQLPGFVDRGAAAAAAPLKMGYVLASATRAANEGDTPLSAPLPQCDAPDSALTEEEPRDEPRFLQRAAICSKIRYLQRETDRELRRIFPAFRTLFFQEHLDHTMDWSTDRIVVGHVHSHYIQSALRLLHRGSLSTPEAAALVQQYLASSASPAPTHVCAQMYFAVHELLMNHPAQFLADGTSHRRSQMFVYRSIEEQQILARVSNWVLTATNPPPEDATEALAATAVLDGFSDRVRAAIAWHELGRPGTGRPAASPPVPLTPPCPVSWTKTDRDMIEFLKISLGTRRELQEDPTGSVAMAIIKAARSHVHLLPDMHAPDAATMRHGSSHVSDSREGPGDTDVSVNMGGVDLQHALVYNFLVRIGALCPWENPNALDTYLRNIERSTASAAAQRGAARTRLTLDPAEEEVRHDFGSLPVYVIDSASAFELDDGVSVEPAGDAQYWVHIHVADPTAWIPAHHTLALEAEQQYASIYFPEQRWPLLPDFALQRGMGLAVPSTEGAGQRAMTFSARVDADTGKVLDVRIGASLLHNVRILTYDQVNSLFASKTPQHVSDTLWDKQSQTDLKTLARLASKLSMRRVQIGGGFLADSPHCEVSISQPLPSLAARIPDSPMYYSGFPHIDLSLPENEKAMEPGTFDGLPGGISSTTMVAEMMLLAGRVAASVAVDRGAHCTSLNFSNAKFSYLRVTILSLRMTTTPWAFVR